MFLSGRYDQTYARDDTPTRGVPGSGAGRELPDGSSADALGELFPASLLGVILLFGGLELTTGALGDGPTKQDRYLLLLTAGIAMWNMGAGYLAGLLLHQATRRDVVRL